MDQLDRLEKSTDQESGAGWSTRVVHPMQVHKSRTHRSNHRQRSQTDRRTKLAVKALEPNHRPGTDTNPRENQRQNARDNRRGLNSAVRQQYRYRWSCISIIRDKSAKAICNSKHDLSSRIVETKTRERETNLRPNSSGER